MGAASFEKEGNVSTVEARALVFRVASDPALLNRLASVADRGETDPTACTELARMVAELDASVSLADCVAVRPEFERATDIATLQAAHPGVDHAAIATVASAQPEGDAL